MAGPLKRQAIDVYPTCQEIRLRDPPVTKRLPTQAGPKMGRMAPSSAAAGEAMNQKNQRKNRWMARALAECAWTLLGVAFLLQPGLSWATPGPDSVLVLAAATTESTVLADSYMAARQIPSSQRCIVQVPATEDLGLQDFLQLVLKPMQLCMSKGKITDRIEAIAVMRGLPRRVRIDTAAGQPIVALTAALMVSQSTLPDDKTPLLGQDPGLTADCSGTPCYAANWPNPYKKGAFTPGFAKLTGSAHHHLWLATAIDGYDLADAQQLAQRGAAADLQIDPTATWLLMQGADPARAALDWEYPKVLKALLGLGAQAVSEPFATASVGRVLAGFATGTADLGATVEGNSYAPGAIIDNLTSFGAVPANFVDPLSGGQPWQVSICRWIRAGATGAHGTVDEPLSNCFPSRQFLVDYRNGATLAEAYLRNMPYVYWKNLVLGDPMTAPYATRPTLDLACAQGWLGQDDSVCVVPSGAATILIQADGGGEAVARVRVLTPDGDMLESPGDSLEIATGLSAQLPSRSLLLLAQMAPGAGPGGSWQSKGWRRVTLLAQAVTADTELGSADADAGTAPDSVTALTADAASGVSKIPVQSSGCGASGGAGPPCSWTLLVFALGCVAWRRRVVGP